MALPIYGYFMNKVYADSTIGLSTADFERPAGFDTELLDCRGRLQQGPIEDDGPTWE